MSRGALELQSLRQSTYIFPIGYLITLPFPELLFFCSNFCLAILLKRHVGSEICHAYTVAHPLVVNYTS